MEPRLGHDRAAEPRPSLDLLALNRWRNERIATSPRYLRDTNVPVNDHPPTLRGGVDRVQSKIRLLPGEIFPKGHPYS